MDFGGRLMELRKGRGWSQEQLGEAVGVTRQTVSKWETGGTTPEMNKLMQLADLFGLTLDELVRPGAGPAGRVSAPESRPWEYEYKSQRTLFGLPLVHIHTRRRGGWGPPCRAKGILAIGDIATGVVALGGFAFGGVALGGMAVGLLAVGGMALGLILALGGLAVGIIAIGGCALGVYGLGGAAAASRVAAGGVAYGHIAIGEEARGAICFLQGQGASPGAIQAAILEAFPDTWRFLAALFGSAL